MTISPRLDALIREAARAAARADMREGGVRNGAMMAAVIAKAARARQNGITTKEAFAATLDDEERRWLGW